ncbi:2Fe-2S iron-sulfur cluster-binding protein [Kitasatospora sp. NPDC050467]|uniref:2Fe-2S iron-sulfur cluster-binding protein n=1 Tax=Kitasatospora sp. NPDC050467 TaxID=3364053 RepID=UPI0037ABF928
MTTDPIETLDAGLFDHAPQVSRELRPCASYTLRVNGFERPVTDAWIGESLLYVLRERLGLAGAKDGCEQGECGACSVQVDGQLVAGCLVPAALAADSEINTVEGLSAAGGASDVQQALAESGAVQCGYCTPGMAMAVHDLLQRNHRPTEVEARQALCGNLCRCTGYRGVLAAVQTIADARAVEAEGTDEAPAEEPAGEAAARTAGAPVPAAPEEPGPAADLPVYTDEDAWIEHVPQPPAEEAPAGGATVGTTAGTGVGGGMQYGTPDGHGGYDAGVYDTAVLPPVPGIPAQADGSQGYYPQQGYPEQAGYPQMSGQGPGGQATGGQGEGGPHAPAHGSYPPGAFADGGYPQQPGYADAPSYDPASPYDGPVYEPTPAHGTALPGLAFEGAGYGGPGYGGPGYGGPGFDGTGFDGTPAHGTPYVPTPPHGVPAEGTAPAGVPYGATPAHGIRLPEDDHAS